MSVLKYHDYIKESSEHTYGIIMSRFDFPDWKDVLSEIDEADLANDEGQTGLEEEPHVTILYGLHNDVDMEKVKNVFEKMKPINIRVVDVSMFDKKEDYDVVKFGVESNELSILHECLKNLIDNSDEFPEYEPHASIAFVKSGLGKKYCDKLTEKYLKDGDMKLKLTEIIIADSDDNKTKITLSE